MPIYRTKEGKIYNISEENVDQFIEDNPESIKVEPGSSRYHIYKDDSQRTYRVVGEDLESFLEDHQGVVNVDKEFPNLEDLENIDEQYEVEDKSEDKSLDNKHHSQAKFIGTPGINAPIYPGDFGYVDYSNPNPLGSYKDNTTETVGQEYKKFLRFEEGREDSYIADLFTPPEEDFDEEEHMRLTYGAAESTGFGYKPSYEEISSNITFDADKAREDALKMQAKIDKIEAEKTSLDKFYERSNQTSIATNSSDNTKSNIAKSAYLSPLIQEEDENLIEKYSDNGDNPSENRITSIDLYRRGFFGDDSRKIYDFSLGETKLDYTIWGEDWENGNNLIFNKDLKYNRVRPSSIAVNGFTTSKSDSDVYRAREDMLDINGKYFYNQDYETLRYEEVDKIRDKDGEYSSITVDMNAKNRIWNNVQKSIGNYVPAEWKGVLEAQEKYEKLRAEKGWGDPEVMKLFDDYNKKWKKVIGEGGDAEVGKQLYNIETEKFISNYKKYNPTATQEIDDFVEENKTDQDALREKATELFYEMEALRDVFQNGPGLVNRMTKRADELSFSNSFIFSDVGEKLTLKGQGVREAARQHEEEAYYRYNQLKKFDDGYAGNLSMKEIFKRLNKSGKAGERLPYRLSSMAEIDADIAPYFNKKLAEWLTVSKAIVYNYDPASMERTGLFDKMGEAVIDRFQGAGNTVTADKEVARWLSFLEEDGEYNIPKELKERAVVTLGEKITSGVPDFALMMAEVGLFKAPVASFLSKASRFARLNTLESAFARIYHQSSKSYKGAQIAQAIRPYAESKYINLMANGVASGTVEGLAFAGVNSIEELTGGHGMPISIGVGFGAGAPVSEILLGRFNKFWKGVALGQHKGMIPIATEYLVKKPIERSVQAGMGTAMAAAVELFDAAVIQGNLDAEMFAEITDIEKQIIMFSQMWLTQWGSGFVNAPAQGRVFYNELKAGIDNYIRGYEGSQQVKDIAKKYNIRNKWLNKEDIARVMEQKKAELINDPKYKGQFDTETGGAFIETELSRKLSELEYDAKTLEFTKELMNIKEIIENEKSPNTTLNKNTAKASEILNQIYEGIQNNPNGKYTLTTEQVDFIQNCPVTIFEYAMRGDVFGKETATMDAIVKDIKSEYTDLADIADYYDFKKGTEFRDDFIQKNQEYGNEVSQIKSEIEQIDNTLKIERYSDINKAPLELKKKQLETRLKELETKAESELNELIEDNTSYLETRRLEDIAESKEIYAEAISKKENISIEKAREKVNENYKTFETTEEFLAASKELGIDAKGATGFFLDGKGKVYIDLQRARDVGKITIGSHEVLHALLDPYLRDPVETRRLVNEFKKELSYEELLEVEKKMDRQAQDVDKEWFNAFSDAIKDGSIEYSPKKSTEFLNIGKAISNIFKRTPAKNAEFKSGKDVYDFIKNYTEGKLDFVPKERVATEPTKMAASKDIMSDQVRKIQDKAIAKTKEWKAAEGEKKAQLLTELKEINAEKQEVIKAENKATEDFNTKERDKLVKKFGKDKGNRLADQNEIVNELVEGGRDVDGNYKMTKEQWDKTGINKAYEALNKGKLDALFKGDLTGDNVFGKSWEEFNSEMRDRITNELIKFNPEKNNSLIGYLNPLIKFRRGDIIKEFKKTEFTKSLDVAAGEAGAVKERGAESGVEGKIDAAAKKDRLTSTAKKVVNLSGEKQAEIMDDVANMVKEQLPNIKKGDYTFFQRKRKGERGGDRFNEVAQQTIKKYLLGKNSKGDLLIPKAVKQKAINPEYRKFLEDKVAPELLEINKTNPELLRARNWKIFYEEVGKWKQGELTARPELIRTERVTNVASQRAKYKQKNPTPKEIADFLINGLSRPNEGRLAVAKLLAEKIAKDALSTAVEESKILTKEEKILIEGENAINKIADKIGVDPTVSFDKASEIIATEYGKKITEWIVSGPGKENLGAIVEKLKKIKKGDPLQIYADNIVVFIDKAAKALAEGYINPKRAEGRIMVDSIVDEVFGNAGIKGGALEVIKDRWGLVLKQSPRVNVKGKKLTKEQYKLLLEESFYEQGKRKASGKELLGYEEYSDIRMKVKGLEQATRNTIRDAWESGKIKTEKELVEFALQRYKNALASSGDKVFDGSVTRSKSDVNKLILTGEKGNNRYSIFKNKSDLLEVLVKPVLGEKVYNEVVEIKKSKTGREGDVYVNGEKAVIKNYAQSTAAIERYLPLMEGLKPGAEINAKTLKNLEQSKENADINKETVISEAKSLIKQLKEGEISMKDVGSWLESIVGDMTAPLRSSYPVDTFILGKSKKASDYRYEHNPPVRTMQIEISRFIKGEITEAQLRELFKDVSAGVIPKHIDNVVNMKYKESKPLEYTNRFDRYLNKFTYGMFKEPIMVFENGKIKLIGEYQAKAYAEVQEAIKANLEVQPSFSKKVPKNAAAQVENSVSFDKALANARKRNQPPKKARVFDFDDTLARTNSRVIYSKPNTTGKPSPKLKAIVLAGGPGSGKSSVVKGLGLEKQGYKVVNQDISLEWAKKLVGLSEVEANYDAVQRSVRSEMGALARKIADKKLDQYTTQGEGVILDGTGASLKATRAKVEALKDQGYDVKMVYVETSKDIALERNRARKERSLKDFIVEKTWDKVNANKAEYAKEFGEDFFEVNTDNLKPGEIPAEFVQAVNERLNSTVRDKLEAGGFAEHGDRLAGEGAQFDFREFSKVIDGKEGPLLNVAKMINEAKGDRNMFVLTARPPEAAASIHEFLKSMGLDIPIENITGLADGAPAAKARWMVEKAAEGYNDFYFADDHIGNVQAVGEALKGLQVKSKVQRAKPKESEKQLTEDLNKELSKEAGKDVSFSFDTKKDLKWKKGKDREYGARNFNTSTKIGGQQLNVRLTEVEKGSWELDFGVGEKKFASSLGKLGITGKGDAYRIFSVVGNGVTDLINKQGLKEINFSAIEPSRSRVYETFTKLWAKRLGWEFEADVFVDGSGSYTLRKPGYKSARLSGKPAPTSGKLKGKKASFSLDTKRDLKWNQHKENDRTFISKFKIGDKKYEIILADASGRGNVEFAFARLVGKDRVFDMVGDGNAYEVVSIVTNGLVDLVKANKIPIKEIVFSADIPSRARVYERIAKMWADQLGWEMKRYDDYSITGADFAISRQEWAQKLIDQKVDKRGFEMQASDPAPTDSERIEPFTPEEQAAVREVFESQQRYREVLDQVDVKSEVQKERASFSKDVDREFNEVLQSSSGVEWYKEFSPAKAQVVGGKKGKRKLILPYSAEDFMGLIYPTLGKGAVGEANLQWYKKNLLDPYNRGIENLSTDRVNLMKDFKALKKQLNVPKNLRKKNKTQFTNEQAVRVYLWDKVGADIPGISKTDLRELKAVIENDPTLKTFADQMLSLTKGDGYSTPDKHWLAGTITTDIMDLINTTKRAKYLAEWKENVDIIYSEKNLNKLEAIHGSRYREALENTLARMKAGKNRIEGGNRLSNAVLNYINQAQGSIMFLNDRSALLQTISAGNFINWTFNNPARASKALLNVPQYAKDFVKIMNSDYLVDRRNGLKLNIAENEIADAARTSTNKAKAILNYIIEKGYLPTKFADSFAIASGGATFYRNRINDLMKKFPDMERSKAEEIAFKEFREASEKSQQSSDPSKISQQQSGDMGRLLLQFVNTPMQYTRLQKRAVQDIINGRGSKKEHISKIIYYGFMQNLWFNFLQQGAFAMFGGDMESDEEEMRMYDVSNGMLDSILRGSGLAGMTVSVLKNVGYDMWKESKKDRPDYQASAEELLGFSPSLKRKYTHFKNAIYPFNSKKRRQEIFDKGFSLDNPAWRSLAKVVEGATNLPVDRMFQKVENVGNALDADTDNWMKVANFLGWPEWQLESKGQKDFKIAKEDPSVYNKKQQIEILVQFGLNDKEIDGLKKEEDRVKKILELQKKNNKYYKPKTSKEEIQKLKIYYDYTKEEQVKILRKHGWRENDIKKRLKTEEDRVNAIIKAQKAQKKIHKP